MEEEWRVVPNHPSYEVSNLGRVRRCLPARGGTVGMVLKPFPQKRGGYPAVKLDRNTTCVHSVVMSAFVGPRPADKEVCHKDGDATNPRLDNLYYGSRSDNVRDAMEHGTWFNVGKEASRWQ